MKRQPRQTLSSDSDGLYGNCTVLPPGSDVPMFRTNLERMAWYLERGLATLVTNSPPSIRLTFEPKGPGHAGDPYFLQSFKNRCVVCGLAEGLSHHHIVPNCYRRFFPRTSQELGRWMYDVLLVCGDCHDRYEDAAHELKKLISKEYKIHPAGNTSLTKEEVNVIRAAAALYRHGDKIPNPKRAEFEDILKAYLKKDSYSKEDCHRTWKTLQKSVQVTPAGLLVAQKITSIDDFAIRWRRHFMKTMDPKFLPELWDPERRIYSEPDQVTETGD